MITNNEKNILRNLIQNPGFRIVENVAKELIEQRKDQSNRRSTEWETLVETIDEEGFIKGINTLIQELYKQSQDQ